MFRKTFLFCILIILLCLPEISSQYNNKIPEYTAPFSPMTYFANSINPYSRGFAYILTGQYNDSSRLIRFDVGNPGSITYIGNEYHMHLANGDFANPDGIWKFYVQDQDNSPYAIYEVDTTTGVITNVGAPVNLKPNHRPIDLEWDQTTNTWYLISQNNAQTEIQLYSMYWPTRELTWIGPSVSTPADIQAGGFNVNGTYFGIDIDTHTLWKVNKYTGVWTQVAQMTAMSNNYQDAAFDRSNYSRLLWCVWGPARFYDVDTATGNAEMIGNFPIGYDLIYGMGISPYPGPQIGHVPLHNVGNLTGPYIVNASAVSTGTGISSLKLYWSRNSPVITDSVPMTFSGGTNWTANIPGNGLGAAYRYYIRANDSLGRSAAVPYSAPANLYLFYSLAPDTLKPVISHAPLGDVDLMLWPVAVNAVVTDNTGLDSVWVKWNINSGTEREFKLVNTSGSNFFSLFKSEYSDVRAGDTIKYRILAQDSSLNHTKDSTGLISFRITTTNTYTCIGTGNTVVTVGTPFHTFWPSFKTQTIWTAAEIAANGGGGEGIISKIAYNVVRYDTNTVNNFVLKMANTPYTNLSGGFVNANSVTVYTGTFNITSNGWYYITLQTPFYWDGVSSLLIETCFGNRNFVTNGGSRLEGTSTPGMLYTGWREDSLMCSLNPSGVDADNNRPNLCFIISHEIGIGGNPRNIPAVYNLFQNYPNPFNPVTRINYDVPKQDFVTLTIYDILGKKIKTLVCEMKQPGSYSVDYNASGLPSGIYFFRLEGSGYSQTKKMVLLK